MTGPTTLRAAGLRMRELQREYFRIRSRDTLIASKAAEKEFDRLLADHALPATAVADHGIPSGVPGPGGAKPE